jgi:hypothetical protein
VGEVQGWFGPWWTRRGESTDEAEEEKVGLQPFTCFPHNSCWTGQELPGNFSTVGTLEPPHRAFAPSTSPSSTSSLSPSLHSLSTPLSRPQVPRTTSAMPRHDTAATKKAKGSKRRAFFSLFPPRMQLIPLFRQPL